MPLEKMYKRGYSALKDDALWQEVKSGNKDAFVHLYNTFADDLLRYGFQLAKDKSIVEDTIHDLYVSIWDQKATLVEVHSIKYYLMSALRRMLLRKIKKEDIRHQKEMLFDEVNMVPSFLDANFQTQDESALIEKIRSTLQNLSERQREIIYLKFYQNLSYQDIANLLELDQKYTYNLAARAYASFKEQFKQYSSILLVFLAF